MQRVQKHFVAPQTLAIETGIPVSFAVEIRKLRRVKGRKLLLYQYEIPQAFDFGISWRGRSSSGLCRHVHRFRID